MAIKPIKNFSPNTTNVQILNEIWYDASDMYQSRIPEITQANIEQGVRELMNYRPAWNEFISALINKIGLTIARTKNWTNPLAKFKMGVLEYGESIEEIQTGLAQAYAYDPEASYGEQAIFGKETPEVQADYHHINRQDMYKITVQQKILKRAFTTETGLAKMIDQLMQAPSKSDNIDEYLAMRQLFALYEENGGFYKVHVPEIPDTDAEGAARSNLRTIRAVSSKLGFVSRKYNAAKMPVHADLDDLELFVTPEYKAAIDVEALAVLFNVDRADVNTRITVIDDFGIPGVVAILTTRDFFVVADTEYTTTSAANPVGLYDNYFLHHHQIISASRFVPAIAFTTNDVEADPENEITVTGLTGVSVVDAEGNAVTEVERGQTYYVTYDVTTDPADASSNGAVITVSGNESPRTDVSNYGNLHVFAGEEATSITVTVKTTRGEFSEDVALSVVGARYDFWPNPGVIPDSDNDGLLEVTPKEPTFADNVVTIPSVTGVQYSVGGAVATNGSTHEVTAETTVTAAARDGYEIASGATASWTFNPA